MLDWASESSLMEFNPWRILQRVHLIKWRRQARSKPDPVQHPISKELVPQLANVPWQPLLEIRALHLMAKSRLTIICNTQVHNMKENLWLATQIISHSMALLRPKQANSMLNRVLPGPQQAVQQLLIMAEEITWMLWVEEWVIHNKIGIKLTLNWVLEDERIVLGLPWGRILLKFSRDLQEQIVTMKMVKNLLEVENCLQGKYYLDKKLRPEVIAMKIDLSKPHIWMLDSNGQLDQILRLV